MGGLITSIYSWATDRLEFWIMKYLTFASLRWEIYFEKCNQGVIILHLEKLMLLWEEWASSTIGLKMFSSCIHFMIYSFFAQVILCQINILCHQFSQTWPLILSDLQQFLQTVLKFKTCKICVFRISEWLFKSS